jgi:hypothetical protein
MIHGAFTHEIDDDPLPRRRVRISGPVYGDDCVPLSRVEYEDGNIELLPRHELRGFRPLGVLPSRRLQQSRHREVRRAPGRIKCPNEAPGELTARRLRI